MRGIQEIAVKQFFFHHCESATIIEKGHVVTTVRVFGAINKVYFLPNYPILFSAYNNNYEFTTL